MARLAPLSGVGRWLAQRFELSRGGSASNLLPMEGLRGFAVFLVFLVHYATLVQPWLAAHGLLAILFDGAHEIGNAGVDLFFVLSGYLIYGHLIASPQPFRRYFGRRVRRIYPAFLAVFAIYVALSMLRPGEGRMPTALPDALAYITSNLLLLPGMLPIEPLITVAWSLSYEMFYYLVMPAVIVVVALHGRGAAWRLGFFAVLTVVAFAAAATLGGPARLIMFLAGVLLYEAMKLRPAAAPGSPAAFVALVLCLAALLIPMPGPAGQALRVAILGLGFFVLCHACFARRDAAVARLFCWTPLRWLGNMSYSYYLLHGLTLKVLFTLLPNWLPPSASGAAGLWLVAPFFLLSLLPPALLFLAVERPFSLAPPVPKALPGITVRGGG